MNKRVLLLLTAMLGMAFLACNPKEQAPAQALIEEEPSELIINLISDPTADPHSTLMGLHLAQKALGNEMDVTVFMNVHGVKLMAAGADTLAFHGENLHQVLKAIMDNGGTVRACPHCMEAHALEASQLVNGVEVMNDQVMMGKLAENPTVFTY